MGITMKVKGDFSKTRKFFERAAHLFRLGYFDRYGRKGVDALKSATPNDSGLTADSWSYEIENKPEYTKIIFLNSNVQNGVNIAVILQYGHVSRNGGWVEGKNYIYPAIQPIFEEMAREMWKEIRR